MWRFTPVKKGENYMKIKSNATLKFKQKMAIRTNKKSKLFTS